MELRVEVGNSIEETKRKRSEREEDRVNENELKFKLWIRFILMGSVTRWLF